LEKLGRAYQHEETCDRRSRTNLSTRKKARGKGAGTLFEKKWAQGTFSLVICSEKRSQSLRENSLVPKKHKLATRDEKKGPRFLRAH